MRRHFAPSFPLIEDKTLLIEFIIILEKYPNNEVRWINVIFDNISHINIFTFDNILIKYSAKNGLIEIVKSLVEKGVNVHSDNDCPLRWASLNGH